MVSPLALPRIVLLFQKRTHYDSIVQMRKGPSGIICMWHEHLLKDTVNTGKLFLKAIVLLFAQLVT
jgi:hypothetical protein